MSNGEIDPVQFGSMLADVEAMKKNMAAMQADIRELLGLANKSKGGLWAGMSMAAMFGAVTDFLVHTFIRH